MKELKGKVLPWVGGGGGPPRTPKLMAVRSKGSPSNSHTLNKMGLGREIGGQGGEPWDSIAGAEPATKVLQANNPGSSS